MHSSLNIEFYPPSTTPASPASLSRWPIEDYSLARCLRHFCNYCGVIYVRRLLSMPWVMARAGMHSGGHNASLPARTDCIGHSWYKQRITTKVVSDRHWTCPSVKGIDIIVLIRSFALEAELNGTSYCAHKTSAHSLLLRAQMFLLRAQILIERTDYYCLQINTVKYCW